MPGWRKKADGLEDAPFRAGLSSKRASCAQLPLKHLIQVRILSPVLKIHNMSLDLLTNLGFTDSADCLLGPANNLQINLRANAANTNVLYAFIIDESYVAYIGKSVNQLQNRLKGYAKPGRGQKTNIKVNAKVIEVLNAGNSVKIYSFTGGELLQFGGIGINIAAGLEDNLILTVAEYNRANNLPQLWNSRGNPFAGNVTPVVQAEIVREEIIEDIIEYEENNLVQVVQGNPVSFTYTLVPSYWKNNWFNTNGTGPSEYIGADQSLISVHLMNPDGTELVVNGKINRTAQSNGTPRIMLNKQYHNWIREHFNEGAVVRYEILNPNEIRIFAN